MELKGLMICMALFVLGVSQCSDAHSMHRRQTEDANYDDPLLGDEANDDDTLNDTDNEPQPEKVPAVIETTPTRYEVQIGGEQRLECKVSPDKGTVVQWHRDNQLYFIGNINLHPEEVRYSIAEDSKDLVIKNVQASDSGIFRCETVQKVPVAINHTLLVLQKPMIINMAASNGGVIGAGNDLKLTCLVTGSPLPTVLWSVARKDRPNDRLTEKDGEFKIEGNVYSVVIKNVRTENSGQYYCYAINKLGSHQAETTVTVRGKPQVHVPREVVNSDLQIEADLECAAHEEPTPHIHWYKDGVLIEDSSSKYTISTDGPLSKLTVFPSEDGDFGTYTCVAENDYGTHNRSLELVQSPVIDNIDVDGSAVSWSVHSHQPLEDIELQLRPTSEDGEWRTLKVPVPTEKSRKYDISYLLEDKQVEAGEYLAVVKVKNSKSWGGSNEPVLVKIDAAPQYIQHASVFRENVGGSGAHSIQPVSTVMASVLMYLLVRML